MASILSNVFVMSSLIKSFVAAMGVASKSVGAGVIGAVSGPWWRSDGGGCDDVGGGLEGSLEGSPEPVFQRFSWYGMVFLGFLWFLVPEFT